MLKSLLKYAFCLVAYYSGLVHLYRRLRENKRALILMYHRVIDDSEYDTCLSQQGMVVGRSVFAGQMAYLKRAYRVISLTEMVRRIENESVDRCQCAVTFDDGWRDVYANAYSIMKERRIPATIFLSTGFVGTTELFWPEKVTQSMLNRDSLDEVSALSSINRSCAALAERIVSSGDSKTAMMLLDELIESLKHLAPDERDSFVETLCFDPDGSDRKPIRYVLNWDEVREMAENNISFGSHTVSHALLPQITTDEAKSEIDESKREIKRELRRECEHFAYPNGDWNEEIKTMLREAGYRSAVLARKSSSMTDLFALGRINIHNGMSVSPFGGYSKAVFATELSGLIDLIQKRTEGSAY